MKQGALLYENVEYTADIGYINNTFIREYDISKANINILFSKGLIDKTTYDFLYNSQRMSRQMYVGMLQKEESVANVLKTGIIEAKKLLFEANNIKDYEVLSIKNDAVYIINRQLQCTDFGLIQFMNKNEYTSFYKINNLEFYYYYNTMNKAEKLDIKGINDSKLELHKEYMLQLFKDVFYILQVSNITNAINMIKDFYIEYITYSLPVGYYRMFDTNSNYHYKPTMFMGTGFESIVVREEDKRNLDISYNLSLLMEMQKILMSIAFSN